MALWGVQVCTGGRGGVVSGCLGVHMCRCVQVCMYAHVGWACMWIQTCAQVCMFTRVPVCWAVHARTHIQMGVHICASTCGCTRM